MEVANFIAEHRIQSNEISWVTPTGIDSSLDILTNLPSERLNVDTFSEVRIVDVGCGVGVLTEALAKTYPSATILGIEYASTAYRTAQKRLANYDNTIIIGGDASEVLQEVSQFDFVFAINMVQDTENPIQILQQLSQSLKPTGVLAVTAPSDQATDIFSEFTHHDNELNLPYMEMDDITVDGHRTTWKQYAFPADRFKEIVQDCGLRIAEHDELAADATGLLYPMQLLGDEDRLAWVESLIEKQQTDPAAGPTVPLYIMQPRDS